jgi:hypothetical protein
MLRFMLRYIKTVLMLKSTQVTKKLTKRLYYLAFWHNLFLTTAQSLLGIYCTAACGWACEISKHIICGFIMSDFLCRLLKLKIKAPSLTIFLS